MPDEPVSTTTATAGAVVADATIQVPQTVPATALTGEPAVVTPPEPAEFDISKYVDKNGDFKEGWKEALIPKELWKEKFWNSGFANVKDLMQIAGNQAKLVGKKGVIPINPKSSPAEIEEYRRAMGVPKEYKYTPPQGIELVDVSPEGMKEYLPELNKANLTQEQFDVVMGLYAKSIGNLQKQSEETAKREFDEAEQIIRNEAGINYEADLHLANRMIEENTYGWPDETKTKLLEGINDSSVKPYMMKFLKEVASKFVEHHVITDTAVGGGLADLEGQIHTEMDTPAYKEANNPQHKYQVERVNKLFEKRARLQGRQS
jgi:hypothetical protein